MSDRKLVTFDWALKRLLRSKANFDILEGFLGSLFGRDVRILEILESESNRETALDRQNRVDLKVRDDGGEIVLVEIQYERELDYLQRVLFGVSKVIVEHIGRGAPYAEVSRIVSVSILHFDLGRGEDYVYRGTTEFRGLHKNDELLLNVRQRKFYRKRRISDIYPEYYLLKVNQFDDVARDSLDEWIYFLKNGEIREGFRAKGLLKARRELDVLRLSDGERREYERFEEDLHYRASMYETYYSDGEREGMKKGKEEGIREGMEKGRHEERLRNAHNLLDVIDDATISRRMGIPLEEVEALREKKGE